jgi:soluble lytic murein transglycosylase-like protein
MGNALSEIQQRVRAVEKRIAGIEARFAPRGDTPRQPTFQRVLEKNFYTAPPGRQNFASRKPLLPPPATLPMSPAMFEPMPRDVHSLVDFYAKRHQMDPALVRAVVRAESDFDPRSVSSAGAMGLMQLMPDTAKSLGVSDPFDPAQNLDGGVRYLKQMLQRFGDVPQALAAYNAGPSNVVRYQGIPPFPETQQYVQRVMQYWKGEGGR